MQATNVQFSPEEISLLRDAAFILTKNGIVRKVYEGMGRLAAYMKEEVHKHAHHLPDKLLLSNAKISKGENYLGLPYVMLDYPKVFGKADILAIRTFFWWGRYCSISLHTKGMYQQAISEASLSMRSDLAGNAFYCSATGNEWSHDLSGGDYQPVSSLTAAAFAQTLQTAGFIKFAALAELAQWHEMEAKLTALFDVLLKLVCLNGDSQH